ncbi:hypothetical protein TNCT_166591 [Trichonephila clavata]|uniref:Secreted peptide n=1 Tax=Trichonephila clavata TaxID=2740835 RepID=A0A8X6G8C4_TRICU|nr:hypothetical protein TNCT_166591 [Trichonephila clavata]
MLLAFPSAMQSLCSDVIRLALLPLLSLVVDLALPRDLCRWVERGPSPCCPDILSRSCALFVLCCLHFLEPSLFYAGSDRWPGLFRCLAVRCCSMIRLAAVFYLPSVTSWLSCFVVSLAATRLSSLRIILPA